jgi:hypothetical protein
MKLSQNFSLSEMLKSGTAIRLGIDNYPSQDEIENLAALAQDVLQPIRDHFGSIRVNSGYRCLELNRALGSKDTSQHRLGQAADIEKNGVSNLELAKWIRDNLEFDQLILEFWYDEYDNKNNPDADINAGWVHVSYKDPALGEENRNQVLTINKEGTFRGLGY